MERNTIKEMKEILDAIEQGKAIQSYKIDEWMDTLDHLPNFGSFKYRIKPEEEKTRLTNRELSRWLAQGNGEASKDAWRDEITYLNYLKENENDYVDENFRIRKWTDNEWHKPTKEYAFGEEDT